MKKQVYSIGYLSKLGIFASAFIASVSSSIAQAQPLAPNHGSNDAQNECQMISAKDQGESSGSTYYLKGELSKDELFSYLSDSEFKKLFSRYQAVAQKQAKDKVRSALWSKAKRHCIARQAFPKMESMGDLDFSDHRRVQIKVQKLQSKDLTWKDHGEWSSGSLRSSSYLAKKKFNQPQSRALASTEESKNEEDDSDPRFQAQWKIVEGLSKTVKVCCIKD